MIQELNGQGHDQGQGYFGINKPYIRIFSLIMSKISQFFGLLINFLGHLLEIGGYSII